MDFHTTIVRAIAVALLLASPAAGAAVLDVQTSVSAAAAELGDPVRLTVRATVPTPDGLEVRHPREMDAKQHDPLSTWTVTQAAPPADETRSDGRHTRTFSYDLVPFRTGTLAVPVVTLTYTAADGTSATAQSERLTVEVASLLPTDDLASLEPRDVASPVPVPIPRTLWWLAVLGGALVFLLAVWWLARKLRGRVARLIRPPVSPDEAALAELALLEKERLVEHRRIKEYYTRLADTVRAYVGRTFGFDAMDQTTEETLGSLAEQTAADPVREELARLLGEADLVKFARHEPESGTCHRALERARGIVGATRHLLRPSGTDTGGDDRGSREAA